MDEGLFQYLFDYINLYNQATNETITIIVKIVNYSGKVRVPNNESQLLLF